MAQKRYYIARIFPTLTPDTPVLVAAFCVHSASEVLNHFDVFLASGERAKQGKAYACTFEDKGEYAAHLKYETISEAHFQMWKEQAERTEKPVEILAETTKAGYRNIGEYIEISNTIEAFILGEKGMEQLHKEFLAETSEASETVKDDSPIIESLELSSAGIAPISGEVLYITDTRTNETKASALYDAYEVLKYWKTQEETKKREAYLSRPIPPASARNRSKALFGNVR